MGTNSTNFFGSPFRIGRRFLRNIDVRQPVACKSSRRVTRPEARRTSAALTEAVKIEERYFNAQEVASFPRGACSPKHSLKLERHKENYQGPRANAGVSIIKTTFCRFKETKNGKVFSPELL